MSASASGGAGAPARWPHWIDGLPRAPQADRWLASNSPVDGSVVAHLARGDRDDVDAAVRCAARVQPAWGALAPARRGDALAAVEAALRSDLERLAELERAETGKPIDLARSEIEGAAEYFGFYAAAVRTLGGETFDVGPGAHVYTRREPYGVVALLTPWNFAVNQGARGAAPALAAGNAVVLKPSEFSSTTTLELAELASAAGLPAGLLNVIAGTGPEVGEALVTHPLVRRVGFTGSVATGRQVARLAAERLIPVTLELGGKSPQVVFADADLDRAADVIAEGFLSNTGQTCSAGSRLLVQSPVEAELVAAVVDSARRRRPGIELGPLITPAQYERVREALAVAVEEGATAALGGGMARDDALANGLFVEPTIFTEVTNEMRIAREEVFGPVLVVIRFEDEDEAIALANDSPYGLVAGVWTRDIDRALRLAGRIEAGQLFVNGWGAPIEAPFGGIKDSGHGREKGRAALEEYSRLKSVNVAIASGGA